MSYVRVKETIADVVKSGKFGDNFAFVDLVLSDGEGEDQFASDITFARVKLENGSEQKEVSVVIKRQQKSDLAREMMSSNEQFYNEHVMYSEILPFLEKNNVLQDMLPKFFHSHATSGIKVEEDIVVVEDLNPLGYKLAEEKIFLDFAHCALALKSLGKLHALSYAMKQENMEEFLKKVSKLKEVRWRDDQFDPNGYVRVSMERGVLPLIESGENVPTLERFQKSFQDTLKFAGNLIHPEEPIAVICHGDFNRNNIFFRYDGAGNPVAVKLFDVATSRYASPAIDLSFLLYMNTTGELRAAHWDELLEIYHDALSSTIPGCPVPSIGEIYSELRRKGSYGYMIASFFIPMMLDNTKKEQIEDFLNLSPEQVQELARTLGDEKVTTLLTDIVTDMLRFGVI